MIPENFKYLGPERRKVPMKDVHEVANEAIEKIEKATKKAEDSVMAIYAESNNLINSQFQHVDQNIDQVKEDLKEVRVDIGEMRKANEEGHRHIIDSTNTTIMNFVGQLSEVLKVHNERQEVHIHGLVEKFELVISNHDKKLTEVGTKVEEYREETHGLIRTTNTRINELETKLDENVKAADKADAEKWRNVWITVAGIILTAAVTFFISWLMAGGKIE